MPWQRLAWIMIWLICVTSVAQVNAQPVQRAGLIVRYGDGSTATACVTFTEPQINGVDLLQRSGLPLVVQQMGLGAAVCKIGNEGCDYPRTGCFCGRENGRAVYWAFSTRRAGSADWEYAPLGAGSVTVRDGDLHGWAWGVGDASSGAQPPLLSLETICAVPAAATAVPAPTAAPTATAVPTATDAATAMPTDIPAAPATVTDTPAASATAAVPTPAPPTAVPPTATAAPSPGPTAAVTGLPTATAAVAADQTPAASAVLWIVYGVTALLLGGGAVIAARRRKGQR
jgi:hypothetical protein